MTQDMEQLLRLAQTGDKAASEQLVVENSGLIWSVARRYFGRGADPDDLYQLGCVGFLKAIRGFDCGYGTQFSTYAVPKIAGEIRRFLRDDGSVKVSRGLKERAMLIHRTREQMVAQLGREPLISELSERLELLPDEIAQAETAACAAQSIQKEMGEHSLTLEQLLSTDGMEERVVESVTLRGALAQLPEKERLVISLRYYHSLTQQQAARIVGVSQVQISRIEKKALERLRTFF